MPSTIVRKRLARRSGSWKYRLHRWAYHRRPQLIIGAVFACVVALACGAFAVSTSMNQSAADQSADDAPAS